MSTQLIRLKQAEGRKMEKTSFRVAIACLAGGVLGSLAGIEFADRYHFASGIALFMGMLMGALVGYMTYHPERIWDGLVHAWEATLGRDVSTPVVDKFNELWADRREILKNAGVSFGYLALLLGSLYITVILSGYTMDVLDPGWGEKYHQLAEWSLLWPGFPLTLGTLMGFMMAVVGDDPPMPTKERLLWSQAPLIGFLLPFALIGGLMRLLCLKKFAYIRTFFRFIHSEIRTLCAFDSALGAAIGFYAGSWIVGGLAGLVFGLLSYELVSKRWLKLIPAPTHVQTNDN